MLNEFTEADKVYIVCGYTDQHYGVDGLTVIVQQEFSLDPFTNNLFLFCGRRRDRIKALYWEGNGFVLFYKQLDPYKYLTWLMQTVSAVNLPQSEETKNCCLGMLQQNMATSEYECKYKFAILENILYDGILYWLI